MNHPSKAETSDAKAGAGPRALLGRKCRRCLKARFIVDKSGYRQYQRSWGIRTIKVIFEGPALPPVIHSHLIATRQITNISDIHSLLGQHPYQASSIHSRKRFKLNSAIYDTPPSESIPPPPAPPPPATQSSMKWDSRVARERRLLSDLWSMSAATFRRLGKIDQARGAIQEAEVRDENNPAVWVQVRPVSHRSPGE